MHARRRCPTRRPRCAAISLSMIPARSSRASGFSTPTEARRRCRALWFRRYVAIARQRQQRKIFVVAVVFQIKNARETRSIEIGLGPETVRSLRPEEKTDAAANRFGANLAGAHESQQSPCGMERGAALALSPLGRVEISLASFGPAAVGALDAFQPGRRAANPFA